LLLDAALLLEQGVEVRVRLGEGGADRVEAVEQVANCAHAVLDALANGLLRVELWLLAQQAYGRAVREFRAAARGLLDARHDAEQRRFAGPVRPEHADLRTGQERERDVVENLALGPVE